MDLIMDKEHFKISITIDDSTISYESSTNDLEVDDILSTINTLLKSFFSEEEIEQYYLEEAAYIEEFKNNKNESKN